jgi:hypothetical protein
VAVVRDRAPLILAVMAFDELGRQVVDQLCNLFALPLVFALVVVDRILAAGKKVSNSTALAVDFARRARRANG